MDQEILDKINKRLEALEIVHTRYQGPNGPKGDKGGPGSAGRDGRDSTELETLRAERNAFREELNAFRKDLHDLRAAACMSYDNSMANTQNDWSKFIVTKPTHSASYATNHAPKSTSDWHVWMESKHEYSESRGE